MVVKVAKTRSLDPRERPLQTQPPQTKPPATAAFPPRSPLAFPKELMYYSECDSYSDMKVAPSNKDEPLGSADQSSSIPTRQARSRRTANRIVAAAVELLSDKGFEDLSVAEIARKAGVSVGGFYARFPSKQALLDYLQETVLGGLLERARELFSVEGSAQLSAAQVIEQYMAMAVDGFRRHRLVLQQISLHSRTSSDPAFRCRILAVNIEFHDLFRARLHERLAQMEHPEPAPAIDIALTATSAVMREYVLFSNLRPQFEPIEDERLVQELTDLFCSYLRIHP